MLFTAIKQDEGVKITSTKELANFLLDKVDGTDCHSDEEKAEKTAKIMRKLKMGLKLTQKELRFLRQTNPIMYAHAMRVQMMAKATEEQLKRAKSKEEVNRILSTASNCIAKDDPDREYIFASVNRISKEMRQSSAYNKLPATDAEAQRRKERRDQICFEDADGDEDKKNLIDWSPLQDVIQAMPKFEAGA